MSTMSSILEGNCDDAVRAPSGQAAGRHLGLLDPTWRPGPVDAGRAWPIPAGRAGRLSSAGTDHGQRSWMLSTEGQDSVGRATDAPLSRARLSDVARLAGVSAKTVSRVIS